MNLTTTVMLGVIVCICVANYIRKRGFVLPPWVLTLRTISWHVIRCVWAAVCGVRVKIPLHFCTPAVRILSLPYTSPHVAKGRGFCRFHWSMGEVKMHLHEVSVTGQWVPPTSVPSMWSKLLYVLFGPVVLVLTTLLGPAITFAKRVSNWMMQRFSTGSVVIDHMKIDLAVPLNMERWPQSLREAVQSVKGQRSNARLSVCISGLVVTWAARCTEAEAKEVVIMLHTDGCCGNSCEVEFRVGPITFSMKDGEVPALNVGNVMVTPLSQDDVFVLTHLVRAPPTPPRRGTAHKSPFPARGLRLKVSKVSLPIAAPRISAGGVPLSPWRRCLPPNTIGINRELQIFHKYVLDVSDVELELKRRLDDAQSGQLHVREAHFHEQTPAGDVTIWKCTPRSTTPRTPNRAIELGFSVVDGQVMSVKVNVCRVYYIHRVEHDSWMMALTAFLQEVEVADEPPSVAPSRTDSAVWNIQWSVDVQHVMMSWHHGAVGCVPLLLWVPGVTAQSPRVEVSATSARQIFDARLCGSVKLFRHCCAPETLPQQLDGSSDWGVDFRTQGSSLFLGDPLMVIEDATSTLSMAHCRVRCEPVRSDERDDCVCVEVEGLKMWSFLDYDTLQSLITTITAYVNYDLGHLPLPEEVVAEGVSSASTVFSRSRECTANFATTKLNPRLRAADCDPCSGAAGLYFWGDQKDTYSAELCQLSQRRGIPFSRPCSPLWTARRLEEPSHLGGRASRVCASSMSRICLSRASELNWRMGDCRRVLTSVREPTSAAPWLLIRLNRCSADVGVSVGEHRVQLVGSHVEYNFALWKERTWLKSSSTITQMSFTIPHVVVKLSLFSRKQPVVTCICKAAVSHIPVSFFELRIRRCVRSRVSPFLLVKGAHGSSLCFYFPSRGGGCDPLDIHVSIAPLAIEVDVLRWAASRKSVEVAVAALRSKLMGTRLQEPFIHVQENTNVPLRRLLFPQFPPSCVRFRIEQMLVNSGAVFSEPLRVECELSGLWLNICNSVDKKSVIGRAAIEFAKGTIADFVTSVSWLLASSVRTAVGGIDRLSH